MERLAQQLQEVKKRQEVLQQIQRRFKDQHLALQYDNLEGLIQDKLLNNLLLRIRERRHLQQEQLVQVLEALSHRRVQVLIGQIQPRSQGRQQRIE